MTSTWVSNKLAKKIHLKVLQSTSFSAEQSNPDPISVQREKTGRHYGQGWIVIKTGSYCFVHDATVVTVLYYEK